VSHVIEPAQNRDPDRWCEIFRQSPDFPEIDQLRIDLW